MKSDNLLNEIGQINDNFIIEANDEPVQADNRPKRKWIQWGCIAASIFLIASGAFFVISQFSNKTHAFSIKYHETNNLNKIPCSFNVDGMGGGQNYGGLIVKNYSDVASKNPTLNNVNSIKELPVFKNETGLWSDIDHDINKINSSIYFDKPAYEVTHDYNIYGISNYTFNICFRYDKDFNITDQLLDYTFHRVDYALYDLDKNKEGYDAGWYKVMKAPSEAGVLYPVISLDAAEKKLRNGDFFCTGNEKAVAKTTKIISVELEYLTDKYQTYIQPFYKFAITDASWGLPLGMECDNKEEFTTVSYVYVPAVVDKYLEITQPKLFYN